MADSDDKMRSNMERVLRAMDVIPPFDDDKLEGPAHDGQKASSEPAAGPSRKKSVKKGPDGGVPTLDLGEKILAEQRRVTAGKRRGPGGGRHTPQISFQEAPTAPKAAPNEPDTDDLAQLQVIVADIVARDIEELCTGPQRSFC